jgi:hypothetical protein
MLCHRGSHESPLAELQLHSVQGLKIVRGDTYLKSVMLLLKPW